MQGMLLDCFAALPLAVLMLSQSFARPDTRLDERYLSALGGGPWHHDHYACALVSSALTAQANDRSACLRRRRECRSHEHAWKRCETRKTDGNRRLGLSASLGGTAFLHRRT